MNPKLQYLIAQLKDPTTWRGFILLLTACGLSIDEGNAKAIIAFGLALAGLVAMIAPPAKQLTPEAAQIVNDAVAVVQDNQRPYPIARDDKTS